MFKKCLTPCDPAGRHERQYHQQEWRHCGDYQKGTGGLYLALCYTRNKHRFLSGHHSQRWHQQVGPPQGFNSTLQHKKCSHTHLTTADLIVSIPLFVISCCYRSKIVKYVKIVHVVLIK